MALVHAESADGRPLPPLVGSAPYACASLTDWHGRRFTLPTGSDRLQALHDGGAAAHPAEDNLVGAVQAWQDHPDWMDQLGPDSPVRADKQLERDLYLAHWAPHIPKGARVADVGGGVGRFAQWLLTHDCEVELIDADLRSLWCAMDRLTGGPGRLDVHWRTADALGPMAPVDCALAVELLCYVDSPQAVLQEIRRVLKPGGCLLLSVEATKGAALVRDGGPVDAQGIIHLPGDRWVQTYTETSLRALLSDWEIVQLVPTHYVLSGPLEAEATGCGPEEIRALEAQAAANPQTAHAHRAWTAVVR